ncbi:hypothetical protein DFP72DRAFT_847334 [Ephemerocybe angulata]|uniref:F-box domain-containing protein n=1 Tax=Ephemerocybe angulata TaxID=980116 RepID=A0A8H6HYL1_9AGAR|nr:hypothetical protein DFP72DRAFT_847334 [Tulosesus angulatus]
MTSPPYFPLIPRYSHGAPLATIAEEVEPPLTTGQSLEAYPQSIRLTDDYKQSPAQLPTSETGCQDSPPTVLRVPPEVLTMIFKRLGDGQFAAERLPLRERAVALLRASHVSAYFRQVILQDPSLRSAVPFLNDLSLEFLDAVMSRSKPLPIHLSFSEDGTLPGEGPVWDLVAQNVNRVSRLYVGVGEGYRGVRLKNLLLSSACSLVQCTVRYFGDRMVYLNFLESRGARLFNNHSPNLRTLNLTNCIIPFHQYTLSILSGVSIQYNGYALSNTVTPLNVLALNPPLNSFTSLRSLTLINCAHPIVRSGRLSAIKAISFPSLQNLVLVETAEACRQLSRNLDVPAACNRDITVGFKSSQELGVEDAASVAEAVCGFVPHGMGYTHCSVEMGDGRHSLSLTKEASANPTGVTIRFDLLKAGGRIGGVLSLLLRVFTFLILPNHTISAAEPFLYRLWEELALALATSLAFPSTIVLAFDRDSSAPYLLVALLKAMPNVKEVTTYTPEVWANPILPHLLERRNAPALRKLSIPYENVMELATDELAQFLNSRSDVEQVSFPVEESTFMSMGYAAESEIASTLRSIADRIPETVALNWRAR